jgi:hypothetical protein
MAQKIRKPEKPSKADESRAPLTTGELRLGKRNYALLSLGVLLVCLGFVTLRQGSITLAPLLLVLGYCVAIPLALVLKP